MSSIFLAYRSHMTIHDSHMTSAATPPSIARGIIGVSFFPLDPSMVEGKGLSRILSREIVAWVGTRADVCALIGTPVRIQPVYVYTTIHT